MRPLFLSLALLAAASPALANDGLLDSSFGIFSTGRNVIALDNGGSNADALADVLVAADRSIFLVGTSIGPGFDSRYSITHLTANGILDNSFGTNGTVYSIATNVSARRARLDSAGNIVVVGVQSFGGTDRDFHLCRFNQQGQAAVFSGLGSSCRNIAFDVAGGNLTDSPNDFIIEPNGKILIVGVAGFSAAHDFAALTRLLPDGTLDPSFNSTGKAFHAPDALHINHYNAIARRPDGKYIAVGEVGDRSSQNGTAALFARLTTSGALDPSYQAGAGYSQLAIDQGNAFNRDEFATSITILDDGNMLMAGNAEDGASSEQNSTFVMKIKPLDFPSFDSNFGNGGISNIAAGYSFDLGNLHVQSDGKIILLGTRRASAAAARDMHVVRMLSDGTLDAGFGTVGRTTIDFVLPGELDYGIRAAIQNGRIIVAGHSLHTAPQNLDQTIARLSNDLIFADGMD